jgi:hypothetical protein
MYVWLCMSGTRLLQNTINLPYFHDLLRREKLMLDSLLASGAASLSGQWVCITIE